MFVRSLFVLLAAWSTSALAVSWDSVPAKDIVLFYPGQAAWEFVLVPSDHDGAKKFRGGQQCSDCHLEEESDMGDILVSGEKLEPDPISGMVGSVPIKVKAAVEGDNLVLQFNWTDPGGSNTEGNHKILVTAIVDDGNVKEAGVAGCWGTCHNDLKGMPNDEDLTKYLSASRTKLARTGGSENYKPDAALKELMDKGVYLEYWQARIAADGSATGVDGHILDKRHVSDAPIVSAEASQDGDNWTVTITRPLAGGDGRKTLEDGGVYNVGFAIHDDFHEGRRHRVSLEHTLAIGSGDADIVAVKQ